MRRGFTLMELMAVIFIAMVVIAIALQVRQAVSGVDTVLEETQLAERVLDSAMETVKSLPAVDVNKVELLPILPPVPAKLKQGAYTVDRSVWQNNRRLLQVRLRLQWTSGQDRVRVVEREVLIRAAN